MPIITRLAKQRGGSTRIELDSGQRLRAPTAVVSGLEFEEGDEVQLELLRSEIQDRAAEILPEKARRYLARYSKSTEGFLEHFTRKGYPEELVTGMVDSLREEGFLDDDRMAREHVRRRKRNKPRGRKKMVAELLEKGIGKTRAQRIVNEEISREEERRMARQYCEKNSRYSRKKLARRLSSRGFPAHLIHDLLDEFASEFET